MPNPGRQYRLRRALPKILGRVAAVLALPALVCVFLFCVNRFHISLEPIGEMETEVDWGTSYTDPGARVILYGSLIFRDGVELDLPVTVQGSADPMVSGTHRIRYEAEFWNWSGSAERIVRVTDLQPPEITLISIPGYFTLPGDVYAEEGYIARDNCDGDLTGQVIRREQDGFVHYQVTDSSGNRSCISRKIRYDDPVPPEITLMGDETVYMDAGMQYQEPGWTAVDNCDGDVSANVTVTGSVDRYLSGSYELLYTVRDEKGNEATAKRTVVVVPKPQSDTVTPGGKVIYLTFDDGPGLYTRQLLEVLERYNVKATFFVINSDYVHVIRDIAEGGHALGIHSVTHSYKQIYASSEAFFNDLLTMQQIIYDQCGVMTYLMRFPGGSSNTVSKFNPGIMTYLTSAVEDMGFRYFDWNVDSNDAGGARTAKQVFHNIVAGVQDRNVSIVLQHDIKDFSVEAVEKVLAWGIANGYTFLPLDMTSPTAHHGVNN